MGSIIITKPIKVKELIEALEEQFQPDDMVTTGLWIKTLK